MIRKDELLEKCRNLYMSGKRFTLNNGAEIIIPSLPIGMQAFRFLKMRDKIAQPEFIHHEKDGVLQYAIDDDGKKNPVMVKNPENIDFGSEAGIGFVSKMLHAILALNFDVTLEEADGLFSMAHFDAVITWFFTGKDDVVTRPTPVVEVEGNRNNGNGSSGSTTTHLSDAKKAQVQEILR